MAAVVCAPSRLSVEHPYVTLKKILRYFLPISVFPERWWLNIKPVWNKCHHSIHRLSSSYLRIRSHRMNSKSVGLHRCFDNTTFAGFISTPQGSAMGCAWLCLEMRREKAHMQLHLRRHAFCSRNHYQLCQKVVGGQSSGPWFIVLSSGSVPYTMLSVCIVYMMIMHFAKNISWIKCLSSPVERFKIVFSSKLPSLQIGGTHIFFWFGTSQRSGDV